jgi:hypothetical protein
MLVMTTNRKFRRETTEAVRDFLMHWRLAKTYGDAGNPEMAKRIMDAIPVTSDHRHKAALIVAAFKAMQRIIARERQDSSQPVVKH